MGTEIADQVGAATRNGLTSIACVLFELSFPGRIDVIANYAGQHGSSFQL